MKIQKKELLDILSKCMPGVETGKNSIEGANTFIFTKGNVFTFNDSISVTVPLKLSGLMDELEGAVSANEFYKIIQKMPKDEIEIESSEKSWHLKSGRSKIEVNLIDCDYSKLEKNLDRSGKWQNVAEDFLSALKICSINSNKTKYSGIVVRGNSAYSTDGVQMNKATMKTEMPSFWISDSMVKELLKLNKLDKIQQTGNWLHFKTGNIYFSVKVLDISQYPIDTVEKVLDSSEEKAGKTEFQFPKKIKEVIDRASSFAGKEQEYDVVKINVTEEKIFISSQCFAGKFKESVKWDSDIKGIEPFMIYVDSTMILEMLSRTSKFKLVEGPVKDGKKTNRLLFVSENSVNLMVTISSSDDDEE